MEFADHKPYSPGDDFRYIDWNVYARLDELALKTFETEENLYVYIMVDTSASMGFGSPQKLEVARRLAAALAYITISHEDSVRLYAFSNTIHSDLPPLASRGQASQIFEFLTDLDPLGETNLSHCLKAFAVETKKSGIVFLISDFWDRQGFESGLEYLIYNNFYVVGLHLFDPFELNPELSGEIDLVDSESGQLIPLTVRKGTLDGYRRETEAYWLRIHSYLESYNAKYQRISNTESVEDLVMNRFRVEKILR